MNYLVPMLQSYWSTYIADLLTYYGRKKCQVNPAGGWPTGQYDREFPWRLYLHNRPTAHLAVEVGFTSIPFVADRPSDWTAIGICQHPASWLSEAAYHKYHSTSGDCGSKIPVTVADYAEMWVEQTATLCNISDYLYRLEDVINQPFPFIFHFNLLNSGKPQSLKPIEIPKISDELWKVVSGLAEKLGYQRTKIIENFVLPRNKVSTRKKIKYIEGVLDFSEVYQKAVDEAVDGDVFVEVGAWQGLSARYMAQCIRDSGKKILFYVIDTWEGTKNDEGMAQIVKEKGGNLFPTFVENMGELLAFIKPIQTSSCQAAKSFEDKSIKFIFIDADHSYEEVKRDILAWFPKVKSGGVLAGHDFNQDEVAKAVRELIEKFEIIGNSWQSKVN